MRVIRPGAPPGAEPNARRLARDVHDDPVHFVNFIGDSGTDPFQHVVGEPTPIRGHRIFAGHWTEHDWVTVRPAVALHAD